MLTARQNWSFCARCCVPMKNWSWGNFSAAARASWFSACFKPNIFLWEIVAGA
jgi:hypothetical protein